MNEGEETGQVLRQALDAYAKQWLGGFDPAFPEMMPVVVREIDPRKWAERLVKRDLRARATPKVRKGERKMALKLRGRAR